MRLKTRLWSLDIGTDCPRKEDGNFDYDQALLICNLKSLFNRRAKITFDFGKRCIKHPKLRRIYPENPQILDVQHFLRSREAFQVNHARTKSALLFLPFKED